MKKLKLSFDSLLNRITIDGSADRVKVDEMSKVIIEVDDTIKSSVWVTLDPIDRDIVFNGGSEDFYKLPILSTLAGEEAPSEAGVSPRDGGILAMDLSSAEISDIADQTFRANSKGNGYVGVSIDGKKVSPSSYTIFLSENERCTVLKFYNSAPGAQHVARVKWRLCPWATTNGASAGEQIILEPGYAERFSTVYIGVDDRSVEPIAISAVEKRGYDLVPSIAERVPTWVAEDYPRLVQFLEDFFEYYSRTGGGHDILTRLHEIDDIDLSDDDTLVRMMREKLRDFPEALSADPRLLLKLVGHFYEGRGIADSVAFASRAVHGSGSWLGYPAERLLRASGSNWVQEESLRVTSLGDALLQRPEMRAKIIGPYRIGAAADYPDPIGLRDLEGYVIRGMTSGASALVELAEFQQLEGFVIVDLKISSREGDFVANEVLVATRIKDGIEPINLSSAVGEQMVGVELAAGVVPKVGDVITFPSATKAGVDADGLSETYPSTEPKAFVSSVNPFKIEIIEPGWLIDNITTGSLMRYDTTGSLASVGSVTIKKGVVRSLPGYWLDNAAMASDRYIVSNDSGRFQTFSYDLVSEDTDVFQAGHVSRLIHAAGLNRHEVLASTPAVAAAGFALGVLSFDLSAGQNTVSKGVSEDESSYSIYVGQDKQNELEIVDDVTTVTLNAPLRLAQVVTVINRVSQPAADLTEILDNYSFSSVVKSSVFDDAADTSTFGTLVDSFFKAQAATYTAYPFVIVRATGAEINDARRLGTAGRQVIQSGKIGTVFASADAGAYTYFAVSFSSTADATAFSFASPFQATNG